ncbi:MAG: response regulator [Deltaproteobacteria bacterium]|jgi:signal transduction histidine kinase/CheY-like chemotaxis protein|nr:response regulator [Deltaproteobacteria bacterium]
MGEESAEGGRFRRGLDGHTIFIAFIVSLGAVLALSFYTFIVIRGYMKAQEDDFVRRLKRQAVSAAALVSADELSRFNGPEDASLREYADLKSRVKAFAERLGAAGVRYFRIVPDGRIQYIIDGANDEAKRIGIDVEPVAAEAEPGAGAAWFEGKVNVSGVGSGEAAWDGLAVSYAPVKRPDGAVAAVAGVAVDDSFIRESSSRMTLFLSIQTVAVFLVSVCGLASIFSSRRAARRAAAAMRAKTSFLARMSHEIRTPMAAVVGLAELAQREYGGPRAVERINGISMAGASLIAVIDDILDISKVEQGKVTLKCRRYWTGALLSEAAAVAAVRIGERPLKFELDAPPDLPAELYGDGGRVKQILLNLLNNAVKYTPRGTVSLKVRVKALSPDPSPAGGQRLPAAPPPAPWRQRRASGPGPGGGDLRDGDVSAMPQALFSFRVQDSGVGIRPGDLKRIFREYSRVDHDSNSGVEGTGLGLSIARNLARAMGGDIHAESVYGQGSVFTAEMLQRVADLSPMGELGSAPAAARETARVSFTAPEASILVVDDLPSNLIVAEGLIAPYQARVSTASSGREAVLALEKRNYDLVLLDHMMPGMDGIETAQAIRAADEGRYSSLPVIAFTANALVGMREYFLENGFDDFMAKPMDVEELDRILSRWIPDSKKKPMPPREKNGVAALGL